MHRRISALKPSWVIATIAIIVIAAGVGGYVKHQRDLALPTRVELVPSDASVFAGSSIALQARLVGGDPTTPVQWTVVGPGSVTAAGIYSAPAHAGGSAIVVAHADGVSAAARVRISSPPGDVAMLLIACYEGNGIDVRQLATLARAGIVGAPDDASGIAVDEGRRIAFVAASERTMIVDLRTMAAHLSVPQRNSRFSGAAELAGEYFAATDNNAGKGAPGIFVFRVGADGAPQLVATVTSGDTPEGIVAAPDGRTFYVTNVNSNEVIRYSFDGRGNARATGHVATGNRPYGIALDESRNLLFVTDNDTPTVSGERSRPGLEMFQLPELRRIGSSVSTGSKEALPIGVAVDEAGGRVFVTDEGDSNVAVFEVPSLRRLATLPTGKWPWTPYFDAHAARLYVPTAHDDAVDVFDTRTLHRVRPPLQTCAYPTNLVTYAAGRVR